MAIATSTGHPAVADHPGGEDRHLVRGVGWEGYEALLEWFGDDGPRMYYAGGDVELMSPPSDHEDEKKHIAFMIEAIAEGLGIRFRPCGSTTFKRRAVGRGFEPDEGYYFANIARLRPGQEIDPEVEPPPDLCVEVEITNSLLPKLDIYARMGVPEIWRFDGEALTVLLLGPDQGYSPSARSASLPFVPMEEIQRFLLGFADDELAWRLEFRAWVRDVLAPIDRQQQAGPGAG